MLVYKHGAEWARDNRWRPIATAPLDRPVDLWAKTWVPEEIRHTWRRFFGCEFVDGAWTNLPPRWLPQHWTEAMTERRRKAQWRSATDGP